MTRQPEHPASEILEQLAEETVSTPVRLRAAQAHVDTCEHCAAEVGRYRQLFALLDSLPKFAPSPNFGDAVMARVRIQPRESWTFAWLQRFAPRTPAGWAALATLAFVPMIPILMLTAWVVAQPLLSPAVLWQWTLLRLQGVGQALAGWLLETTVRTLSLHVWAPAMGIIESVPPAALGSLVLATAVGIPLSAWGLFRLVRIHDRSAAYVR